jgi:hypothetical protein
VRAISCYATFRRLAFVTPAPLTLIVARRYMSDAWASAMRPHLESGRLRLVKGAPQFHHTAYLVHSDSADANLLDAALHGFRQVAMEERNNKRLRRWDEQPDRSHSIRDCTTARKVCDQ